MPDADFLTPGAVAEMFGVEVPTVRQWRARRQGPPYVQVSPRVFRYPRAELLAFVESRSVRP